MGAISHNQVACFLGLVAYYNVMSLLRVCWQNVSSNDFLFCSLVFFIWKKKVCCVVDVDVLFSLWCNAVCAVPLIHNLLWLPLDVWCLYLHGSVYFLVDLLPTAAVGECSPNVGNYGGVFVALGPLTFSIKTVAWVCGLHINISIEGVLLQFVDESINNLSPDVCCPGSLAGFRVIYKMSVAY